MLQPRRQPLTTHCHDNLISYLYFYWLIGMRVAQVYDIDHKTYLIKLQRTEEKCVLLLESGCRLHSTVFEWPKNVAPSGFSMKMRKHLRNKRLESLTQLGVDRIVDLQFGSGEAAYHVVLELYDRGNIVLTDCNMMILNILRPHAEGEEVRFAVREKYPLDRVHQREGPPTAAKVHSILSAAKPGDSLKKILMPHLDYGPAVIEHALLKAGFNAGCKLGKGFDLDKDAPKLFAALTEADHLLDQALQQESKGYIIQKREKRPLPDGGEEDFFSNQEFHPVVFEQHAGLPVREFPSFDMAVDEFFSTLESQKIDMKALQQEREAMKKLSNVRKDHDQRLMDLTRTQETDKHRAELISRNQQLVDNAILAIRSALANQLPWTDIQNLIKEAQAKGDPVASSIVGLKLEINHITMKLRDPYAEEDSSDVEGDGDKMELKPMLVDIDLDLTAFSNATKYYDKKKSAAKKQQKTLESQGKALKSAEKKTKQTLKEVQAMTNISKARKIFWFEKFFWFISSENYLVIGGRDQQQNELIVKRYMRPGDIYVHADIQGASSIVIKNPAGEPVPPKTLNEAGSMAVSYSVAWSAKVVTNAWWVESSQVSKTAPTGEYLTTGSFMVRGKKNYLPPCHLILGFSFLFKLDDSSVFRHKDERRVRGAEDDASSVATIMDVMSITTSEQEEEIELVDTEDEEDNSELSDVKLNDENEEGKRTRSNASSENNEETEDGKVEFPDTEIKIEHVRGDQITLHATTTRLFQPLEQSSEPQVVFLGDSKPISMNPLPSSHRRRTSINKSRANSVQEGDDKEENEVQAKQQQHLKRGQRGKLKKIKEKYKYQDEEERKLRMEILQSAGTGKDNKKGKKCKVASGKDSAKVEKKMNAPQVPRAAPPQKTGADGEESDGAEVVEEVTVTADVDMLDSLTGLPVPEDELLFAIPVVAPYNTLLNYKFKVKLTPGSGKRGKAAKTAINMFLKERTTTAREKDLIRSVKDENLARNLPGKVKLSAPQLQKLYKK
ncbi:nuclear export mediator factor NEMF homolog isoform X2 [Zootermopsis nevadensis]|uniref:nuclear export mediator factor NEMF homolog isoform X2 n=1 Tax=Zootermopsis nevadensis TaxID=136037 RepID=UPI000B8E535A|nr:nuclear export mediator factor NEMF homolog isoform X2 [Zootermopsis nevadensis]